MTSEKASFVKRKGHLDAIEFAIELGIGKEFRTDLQAKKDVIDSAGYSYSVKSGEKKWQIFLYGETRFKSDYTFKGINGIADLFLKCIECFPGDRNEYVMNKIVYKRRLQKYMRILCEKLKEKRVLEAFLDKSLFNSGEVDFLVIKHEEKFHIFWGKEVVKVLAENIIVENSKAKQKSQLDDQKVLFKVSGITIGEIEMRNDSDIHYREVKFWLDKLKTFRLLSENIKGFTKLKEKIYCYGKSAKKIAKIFKLE